MVTTKEEIEAAKAAIAEEPTWVYDLATENGDIFENVRHMGFFVLLVVDELRARKVQGI